MQGFVCLCSPYVYGYRLLEGKGDNQDDDLHLACSQLGWWYEVLQNGRLARKVYRSITY